MIFATVGTQLPFDRLIRHLDHWADISGEEIFAQVGPSKFVPSSNLRCQPFVSGSEFAEAMHRCDLVVAHAGMGTVINALTLQKKIVVFPRRLARGEHRNDHQMATASWLSERPGVTVAFDEVQLFDFLKNRAGIKDPVITSNFAGEQLVGNIKRYISSIE